MQLQEEANLANINNHAQAVGASDLTGLDVLAGSCEKASAFEGRKGSLMIADESSDDEHTGLGR